MGSASAVSRASSTISIELQSDPSAVTLVRGMLSGLGELFDLDPELVDDVKTAVSEACNNVVLHAYPEGSGPLIIEIGAGSEGLEVSVRDHGRGIRHVAGADEDRMGLGLAVISALADVAQFQSEESGTAVRMVFGPRQTPIRLPAHSPAGQPGGELASGAMGGDVRGRVAPPALLGGVLGRIARALAAGAHFSLDRFSDLYLIADELAAHADSAASHGELEFAITAIPGRLELMIGRLRDGTVQRLTHEHGPRSFPLIKLVDEISAVPDAAGELLRVVVADRHR
jgi:serine/threonine-protein kinase RsbW